MLNKKTQVLLLQEKVRRMGYSHPENLVLCSVVCGGRGSSLYLVAGGPQGLGAQEEPAAVVLAGAGTGSLSSTPGFEFVSPPLPQTP